MTTSSPSFDALRRGHVVLAPDPFTSPVPPDPFTSHETTRPWAVCNNEHHPFDGRQYVVMGLTTRTWYDERVPIDEDEYRHRKAPRDSAIVPHAVASLSPALMTDYVCRIRTDPLDRAVEILTTYLDSASFP